ncbi:MAG: TRAP transporter substrate-binding protein DctP [Chloroflexi bacterium]|nr:TRAP transporter substrate-binding protein DctP [Chloroflexota bacterium]
MRYLRLLVGVLLAGLLIQACGGGQAIREPAKPAASGPAASSPDKPAAQATGEPAAQAAPKPATKPTFAPAPPGTIVWNLPTIFFQSDYQHLLLTDFINKVREKSGGKLEIRMHPASSLYNTTDIPPAMIDGRVEIGSFPTFGISDARPNLAVADLPFASSSEAEGRKVLEALIPYHKQELAKLGLVHLMTMPWPAQQLFTAKDPVRTVDDWKGRKIRTYSVESADFARAMGASPVTMPVAELYVGIQRGLAEGVLTSTLTIRSTKTFEVMKYANLWNWTGSPTELISVNKKAYDALPADLQKVLTDVMAQEKYQEKVWEPHKQANADALKAINEAGVQNVQVDAAELAKAKDIAKKTVWQNWLKRAGPSGEEALKIVETATK